MLKVGISGYQIWYHSIVFAEEIQKSKSMKVVSVFDENPEFAKRLGEAAGGVKVFTDIDEFIESGIDMIIMAGLPSKKLNEIKKYAAAKKHILIDKPVSITSDDALEIANLCNKEKVKAMIGYNLHWSQAMRQAHDILREGKLGKPVYAFFAYDGPMLQETEWSTKPGWLMDQKENMSYWFIHVDHGIDILMWLLDAKYTDVYAQIQNIASPQYASTDWGVGLFTMDNGVKAILKCDGIAPAPFEILNIRIICEDGGLVFDYFPSPKLQVSGKKLSWGKVWEYDFKDDLRTGMAKMAEEFVSYVIEDKPVPKYQSVEIAGYRLLKAAEIAHKSNDLNKHLKISYEV
ncbi:MAG: Gfo/Idh/MocA family oxidoreductase [Actinobacteria bacterium]|nr:Gfo/Idh/MocA family oxidoreductase [Actinomycetota bacterium]